jgi:hypothetical protein
MIKPDDPEWFGREMAIAVAPPWWFWQFLLRHFSWLVSVFGRVQVTGELPDELRDGPLLFAANHIGDVDPFVVAVALHKVGATPRIMTTGGILDAPVAGPVLERTGAIRVERGTELARHAVRVTEVALVHGGHIVAYPEGRVGRTPDGWPERGRTGMARLALGLGVPVIPVIQWGAHEVLQYANDGGEAAHPRPGDRPPSRPAGARGPAGPARRPTDGAGRRRQPGPVPHRGRDHEGHGPAPVRGVRPAGVRRPDPPHDGGRRLPGRRRPGRGSAVTPRCWTGRPRAGNLRP